MLRNHHHHHHSLIVETTHAGSFKIVFIQPGSLDSTFPFFFSQGKVSSQLKIDEKHK